jgi:hypothetical protein
MKYLSNLVKITASFNCSYNRLNSLVGVPQSVGGYFNYSDNKLTNLKEAPKLVKGNFYCNSNQ